MNPNNKKNIIDRRSKKLLIIGLGLILIPFIMDLLFPSLSFGDNDAYKNMTVYNPKPVIEYKGLAWALLLFIGLVCIGKGFVTEINRRLKIKESED